MRVVSFPRYICRIIIFSPLWFTWRKIRGHLTPSTLQQPWAWMWCPSAKISARMRESAAASGEPNVSVCVSLLCCLWNGNQISMWTGEACCWVVGIKFMWLQSWERVPTAWEAAESSSVHALCSLAKVWAHWRWGECLRGSLLQHFFTSSFDRIHLSIGSEAILWMSRWTCTCELGEAPSAGS